MNTLGFNQLRIRSLNDFKVIHTHSNTKFGEV